MEIELDDFLEKNIICSQCLNIPLLGIEFLYEAKNLSEIIKLHSFCLFHKNKNRVNEFMLDNIYKEKAKNKKEDIIKISCEVCQKNGNEYLCLDCKRNICKECSKYHKSHKLYKNNEYLISKDDYETIMNNFKNAKNNLNKNLAYIMSKINSFKSQLQNLENLYNEYKDLNDKLISLTQFILEKYQNEKISGKPIYYPIYFNIKNVLEFNFQELNLKDDDDLSIKSFTNSLLDRIKSGLFFLLSDSKYNQNLNDYTNEKLIKINTLKIEKFKEIKIEYSKFIILEDKTKIVGIKNNSNLLEIYNIQNESVEATIKLDTQVNNYNIFLKDDILLLVTNLIIYIINPKAFSIMQKINLQQKKTNNAHQFLYGDIISKDSIGIIYWGNLGYLADFSFTSNLINLPIEQYHFCDLVNFKEEYFEEFEKNSHKYIYFLLYKKDNLNNFILKKVILLVKRNIGLNEVSYVSYKHFEVEDKEPYCSFYFDSLNRFSDTEYVISFNSQIKAERDQYNYYITDNYYSNRIIYYYLNIEKDDIIETEICYSEEKSFLHKIENTFYFFFTKSEKSSNDLKEYLKDYKFIGIKMDEVDFKDFYYQNRTILGWNYEHIYLGEIYSNKLEIIQNIHKSNDYKICFICLNPNIIFYNNSINPVEEDNNSEDYSSDNDSIDDEN